MKDLKLKSPLTPLNNKKERIMNKIKKVVCNLADKHNCKGKCIHAEEHEPTTSDTLKLCVIPVICVVKQEICVCK